jgi:hypothetical protein
MTFCEIGVKVYGPERVGCSGLPVTGLDKVARRELRFRGVRFGFQGFRIRTVRMATGLGI